MGKDRQFREWRVVVAKIDRVVVYLSNSRVENIVRRSRKACTAGRCIELTRHRSVALLGGNPTAQGQYLRHSRLSADR
jgi:hypothetical protein